MTMILHLIVDAQELIERQRWCSPFLSQEAHRALFSIKWLGSQGDMASAAVWLQALHIILLRDTELQKRGLWISADDEMALNRFEDDGNPNHDDQEVCGLTKAEPTERADLGPNDVKRSEATAWRRR